VTTGARRPFASHRARVGVVAWLAVLAAACATPTTWEAQLGAGHAAMQQAHFAAAQGHFESAARLGEAEFGAGDERVATALTVLAGALLAQGRLAAAEAALARALAIGTEAGGERSVGVGTTQVLRAAVFTTQGRLLDGESAARTSVAILQDAPGQRALVAAGLTVLGTTLVGLARAEEAEAVALRLVELQERALGADHPELGPGLQLLGFVYRAQGRLAEAEPLYQRALAVAERAPAPGRLNVAAALTVLADVHLDRREYAKAEAALARALRLQERIGGPTLLVPSLIALTRSYGGLGRAADAERAATRALALVERTFGLDTPLAAAVLDAQAGAYLADREFARAQAPAERAAVIREATLGEAHPLTAASLVHVASALIGRKDLAAAYPVAERALRLALRTAQLYGEAGDEAFVGFAALSSAVIRDYLGLLTSEARNARVGPAAATAAHAFTVAEQARGSRAQLALARAHARLVARDPDSAGVAREADAARNRLQDARKQLSQEYARPAADRDAEKIDGLRGRLPELERAAAEAAARLRTRLPRYAELVAPEPIDARGVAALLRPSEALLAYLALDDRVLAWLVRPGAPPAYRDVAIDRPALAALVDRVRRSLDQRANADLSVGLLPVDVAGALRLYRLLVEPFRQELDGTAHLLVVPDDLLLPVPFAALVTDGGSEAFRRLADRYTTGGPLRSEDLPDYARLPWLARAYTLTTLPSATALRLLRRAVPRAAAAGEAFVGLGDPVLAGPAGVQRGGSMLASRGEAALDELRRLARLPGTRRELLAVARALGLEPSGAVYVGAAATKQTLRGLNASGRLGRTRVVSFATHALIGGEVRGITEPALVLSAPEAGGDPADSLLGLAEVMELKLHGTEWVVLSACNTAAPDGSAEGLSGLVRAFFFAGAPALLVSHWSVEDRATEALMSEIFRRFAGPPGATPARALQQAMLALMDGAAGPTGYHAHPFAWAPFFLVGEGRAGADVTAAAVAAARPPAAVPRGPAGGWGPRETSAAGSAASRW
jgi:CHAT domain-containing protein